jgi:hypothetical protein
MGVINGYIFTLSVVRNVERRVRECKRACSRTHEHTQSEFHKGECFVCISVLCQSS